MPAPWYMRRRRSRGDIEPTVTPSVVFEHVERDIELRRTARGRRRRPWDAVPDPRSTERERHALQAERCRPGGLQLREHGLDRVDAPLVLEPDAAPDAVHARDVGDPRRRPRCRLRATSGSSRWLSVIPQVVDREAGRSRPDAAGGGVGFEQRGAQELGSGRRRASRRRRSRVASRSRTRSRSRGRARAGSRRSARCRGRVRSTSRLVTGCHAMRSSPVGVKTPNQIAKRPCGERDALELAAHVAGAACVEVHVVPQRDHGRRGAFADAEADHDRALDVAARRHLDGDRAVGAARPTVGHRARTRDPDGVRCGRARSSSAPRPEPVLLEHLVHQAVGDSTPSSSRIARRQLASTAARSWETKTRVVPWLSTRACGRGTSAGTPRRRPRAPRRRAARRARGRRRPRSRAASACRTSRTSPAGRSPARARRTRRSRRSGRATSRPRQAESAP